MIMLLRLILCIHSWTSMVIDICVVLSKIVRFSFTERAYKMQKGEVLVRASFSQQLLSASDFLVRLSVLLCIVCCEMYLRSLLRCVMACFVVSETDFIFGLAFSSVLLTGF